MTYFLVFVIGAWFAQCLITAEREHRGAGIPRSHYFLLCVLISSAWPILVGSEIRDVLLRRRKKKPSLRA